MRPRYKDSTRSVDTRFHRDGSEPGLGSMGRLWIDGLTRIGWSMGSQNADSSWSKPEQRLWRGTWGREPQSSWDQGHVAWEELAKNWGREPARSCQVWALSRLSACQVFLLGAPPLASFWPRILLSPFVFPIQTSYSKPNFPSGHNVFQYSLIPKLGFQSGLKEPARESLLGPPPSRWNSGLPWLASLPEPQESSPPACTPGTAKSLLFQLGTCPCCFSCPFLSPTCSQGLLN